MASPVDQPSDTVRPLVEACVTSVGQAATCEAAGAHRLEICRHLDVGGLTPGRALVESIRSVTTIPIVALARAQSDTFRLTPDQVHELVQDVARLAPLDVDGIVLGPLDRRGRLDLVALQELVDAAGQSPVTFHRAFDELSDPMGGLEALASVGVARLLTSGGASSAWVGRRTLRALVEASPDGLVVVGGGRVRADHVQRLVDETGLREVHARAAAIPDLVQVLRQPSMP